LNFDALQFIKNPEGKNTNLFSILDNKSKNDRSSRRKKKYQRRLMKLQISLGFFIHFEEDPVNKKYNVIFAVVVLNIPNI
jgi:hypothetical protein